MSIRAFHIVFVTISTMLFLFLAIWAFGLSVERNGLVTGLGVIGALGTVAMPVYGIYFYRKVKNIVL